MSESLLDPSQWSRIAPYLDRALDLEPSEREEWLQELATTQPETARTVRELLAEREVLNAREYLEHPPLPSGSVASLAGQQLGPYTLDRQIGHGGMGTVWLAHRSDGRFKGRAAVKLLNAALVGHPFEQRFVREGSVLARLQHPNIAHLIDAGVAAGSQPYLILEYIEGARIDRYCEQRALSIEQRIELFLDVLAAVAHAHSHLIVHRDLKPSNILVTDAGVVKLLDFGIAALLAPTGRGLAGESLTREVAPGLTPEYAAPEQLLDEPVTTATDVYALGLVLFVLLAGRHPASTVDTTHGSRVRTAIEGDTPRPSEVAVDAGHVRLLRGDLDNIIAKALKKEPTERYTTADLFAADLRRYLAREPVTARASTFGYRARKFVSRRRGSVVATLIVVATFVGAFAVTKMQLTEARVQREAALASARRAGATKDFLQLVLSELQSRGEPLTTQKLLELSSTLLKAQYRDQPTFVSEMLIELALEYDNLMEMNAGLDMLTNARDIARAQHNDRLLAVAECTLVRMRALAGFVDAAQSDLTEGLQALARIASPDVEVRARCLWAQGDLREARGDRAGAIEIEQRARAMLEAAGATHGTLYATILSGLALNLANSGRAAEALSLYQLSAETHARNGRGGTRMQTLAEQDVAATLYRLGEVREADQVGRRVWDRLAKLSSSEDLGVAVVINAAGRATRAARHHPAHDLLAAAVVRAESSGNRRFFQLGSFEMARMRLWLGAPRAEVEAPLDHLERALIAGANAITPATHVLVEMIRAELDLRDGKPAAADARATQLLGDLAREKFTAPQPNYNAQSIAAKTALAVGDATRAIEHANAALRIVEPIARGPETSADVGDALVLLGRAMMSQGRSAEARPLLQRAVRCLSNGYGADHPKTRAAQALL